MHWSSILTLWLLALGTAYLVHVEAWAFTDAVLMMSGIAIVFILCLLGTLLAISRPEERPGLWGQVITTFRQDFSNLMRWFWIRR